ncbi:MAG: HAD-IIB family hydrolase [Ruminococcaceae bacterium]|nr:HAD-IIB family hydrolase [Oscillospiraceae bacterium]
MGKFDGYIIASDLDGTFLGNRSDEIERNVEKIKYFTSNGGRFTFATGRIPAAVINLLPRCSEYVNFPAVICNGMWLYDISQKRAIFESYGDSEAIEKLSVALYKRYPHLAFRGIGVGEIIAFQPDNRYIKQELKSQDLSVRFVPLEQWHSEKFLKLTLRDESELLNRIKNEIEKEFEGVFDAFKSGDELLEVQPTGFSKAAMLSGIRERLRDNGEKVKLVCIGDHENDLEMLRIADIAACPSNAIPEVKEICDVCLCDNDSGAVADLIEYIEGLIV